MLAAVTGTAWAQTDPRWRDPTRAWSIDFVSSEWGHAEGLPADGPALLTMPMRPAQTDAEVRMCFVEQAFAPLPQGEGEAEIRARVEQVDAAQATAAFPRMQLTQVNVTHAVIDGHTVAVVEGVSRGSRFRGRVLMTRFGDRITLSTIACISASGMQPAAEAEVDAILATLRFAERAAP
jgi:hypothetical protein